MMQETPVAVIAEEYPELKDIEADNVRHLR
jgi:hypothetical protein